MKKIEILGKNVEVAFNGLAMTEIEAITGKSFFEEKFDTQKARAALIYACIFGADEDTSISMNDILKNAKWGEFAAAFNECQKMSLEFFELPTVVKNTEGTEKTEDTENEKN